MLKTLGLPLATSAAVAFLSIFATSGIAQVESSCFMVNSSGQTVNLGKLCQDKKQTVPVASVCEGPFDRDGFPIALTPELERLELAVAKAKQQRISSNQQSGMVVGSLEIQAAMEEIMRKIPPLTRMYELQQKQAALYNQPEVVKKLEAEITQAMEEMSNNPCYIQLMQAFGRKIAQQETF